MTLQREGGTATTHEVLISDLAHAPRRGTADSAAPERTAETPTRWRRTRL